MMKNISIPVLMITLPFLLTSCGASTSSNTSTSEVRNSYSVSDFSFSDDSSSGFDSSDTSTTTASTFPETTTSTKELSGVVIYQNENNIMYLKLNGKTKLTDGYKFDYSIVNNTLEGMTFYITAVTCNGEDITETIDLSMIEVASGQSTSGDFSITSSLLDENSVFYIIGDWITDTGFRMFSDFSYEFNISLIENS